MCMMGDGKKKLREDDYMNVLVSACESYFVNRKTAVGGGAGGSIVAAADPRKKDSAGKEEVLDVDRNY